MVVWNNNWQFLLWNTLSVNVKSVQEFLLVRDNHVFFLKELTKKKSSLSRKSISPFNWHHRLIKCKLSQKFCDTPQWLPIAHLADSDFYIPCDPLVKLLYIIADSERGLLIFLLETFSVMASYLQLPVTHVEFGALRIKRLMDIILRHIANEADLRQP